MRNDFFQNANNTKIQIKKMETKTSSKDKNIKNSISWNEMLYPLKRIHPGNFRNFLSNLYSDNIELDISLNEKDEEHYKRAWKLYFFYSVHNIKENINRNEGFLPEKIHMERNRCVYSFDEEDFYFMAVI